MEDSGDTSRRGEREGEGPRRIRVESEALDRHLEGAWTRLGDSAGAERDPGWDREAKASLARLREGLARLFELEERPGGLFAEVVERDPARAPRLEELRRQHLSILRQIEGLLERVDGGVSPGDPAFAKNVSAFLESLRTQRSIERSLLKEACPPDGPAAG